VPSGFGVHPRSGDRFGRRVDKLLDVAEISLCRLRWLNNRAAGESVEELGFDGQPLQYNLLEESLVVAAGL
jgi:hypothetical protein